MPEGPDPAPSEYQEDADEVTVVEQGVELERTIGLGGALSIGVGTMVGAGIFVFPGLAAGQAGPAAAVSFAIGGVVAMLVALPTSELATAMPRSGGGYYFISRGVGPLLGTMVGLSLWSGLIFASAFYLVGFGHYATALLTEAGLQIPGIVLPLALTAGGLLTGLSVLGTENTAKLQNGIVGILLVILVLFLGYGSLDALGLFGRQTTPEDFRPFGNLPILTTAALVFTSYLGFAQVATVAGEVKEPAKTLPRAMVGSVLIVTVLYVITILVATSTFGSQHLASLGETAMIEVARELAGVLGAVAILGAGLLATLSSANASILSSSRSIYAVARDRLVPEGASRINLRFGTPHVALVLAGVPTLVLVATGQVEVLAEVASFLHLIMYGLICVAMVILRFRSPAWYDPSFRTPGYPWLPVIGAVASFALILFMQPLSQIVGLALLVLAATWHVTYARDVELPEVDA